MPGIVKTLEELSAEWLSDVLRQPVRGFDATPVGTGQMSANYRVALDWDGEVDSMVLKVASQDPNSRATGVQLGAYSRETTFYSDLAPRIGGPLADCHASVFDPAEGWFTLLIEDVAPAVQGDQLAGCSVDEARVAMLGLAQLHGPVLGDVELGSAPWLNQPWPLNQALVGALLPGFFERYDDRLAADHRAVIERFVQSIDAWGADRRAPLGLVHGDYRLDNMLFGAVDSPTPFTVVDWQTVGWGACMYDASYFLGGSLRSDDRAAHEEALVRSYVDAISAQGVTVLTWDHAWEEYRRQSFGGVLMAVAASMLVQRTERGDDMFMTLLARHCRHVIDLDAIELLSAPGEGRPPAMRPEPADEGRHDPGPEQLWNESWYLDAASADGSLGLYVRLGLYPNLGVSWYTTYIVGPGRDSVAVVDFEAPLPADGLGAEGFDHVATEPLERFQVTLTGAGQSYADPAAALRGEPGEPVDVSLDLEWATAGIPYSYRMTTRYEIPCDVKGTVRIGDEEIAFEGPGQRDHSWGPRDWWSMDWVWSAAHMEDGERLHAVQIRIPDMPLMNIGYAQNGDDLVELDGVEATEEVRDDGLIESASLGLAPSGISLDVEPLAWGPLRLVAPDGRVAQFPRALCRFTAADGRTGVGWVEWNRNLR